MRDTDDKITQGQLDDLLRRALATPPISNEEIIRRSKQEPRKRN